MDSMSRPTLNLRHPIRVNLPAMGRTIRLPDGREGYIAGRSEKSAGKMTFIEVSNRKIEDMWPAEFAGFEVSK